MKTFIILGFLIYLTLAFNGREWENCRWVVRYSDSQSHYNDVSCQTTSVVNGTRLNFTPRNHYPTRIISFTHSIIPILPANYFSTFPHLERLFLHGSRIERIERDAFYNLRNLEDLTLYNNSIQEIIEQTFLPVRRLKFLNLAKNRLQSLNTNSFYGLTSLERLDLSFNLFSRLNSNVFCNTPSLRWLKLSNNKLHDITSDALKCLVYLQSLTLDQNFLEHLPADLFHGNEMMLHLDLSNNPLKDFSVDLLPEQLISFNISNNVLDIDSWSWIQNLETADLSNTTISDICIGSFTKRLYLNHNHFSSLKESNLQNATNLLELELSYNSIQRLPKDVFKSVRKLEKLNLSHNNLSDIPIGSFSELVHLSELRLSNNALADIEFGTFSGLDNVSSLYLDHNNLTSLPEKSFYVLRKLKFLYIDNNHIHELDVKELLRQTSHLNHISINVNSWNCKKLFNVITLLTVYKVNFENGTNYSIENVNGIGCTDKDDFGHSQLTPINITQDSYTSLVAKISRYFDNEFKNSSFYKFFQQSPTNPSQQSGSINFFKYHNKKEDESNKSEFESKDSNEDEYNANGTTEPTEENSSSETDEPTSTTTEDDFNSSATESD